MYTSHEMEMLLEQLESFVKVQQKELALLTEQNQPCHKLERQLIHAASAYCKSMDLAYKLDLKKRKQAKVLLIDDVASARQANHFLLTQVGIDHDQIDEAHHGNEGYKFLKQAFAQGKPYNLVICDWEMPKMTGLSLLRMVRLDEQIWSTPFYLVTGMQDKEQIVKAIDSGASGYIVKPVNQKRFVERFKKYSVQQRAVSET